MIAENFRSRGLTLLEVLISAAILATLAAVAAPTLARALSTLRQQPTQPTFQTADLAFVADTFLDDPERFGAKDVPLHTLDYLQIAWPDDDQQGSKVAPTDSPVTIRAMRESDSDFEAEPGHLWLRFECEGISLVRWIAIPPSEVQESKP